LVGAKSSITRRVRIKGKRRGSTDYAAERTGGLSLHQRKRQGNDGGGAGGTFEDLLFGSLNPRSREPAENKKVERKLRAKRKTDFRMKLTITRRAHCNTPLERQAMPKGGIQKGRRGKEKAQSLLRGVNCENRLLRPPSLFKRWVPGAQSSPGGKESASLRY